MPTTAPPSTAPSTAPSAGAPLRAAIALIYHDVVDAPVAAGDDADRFLVRRAAFAAQLDAMATAGTPVRTLADAAPPTGRDVLITVDDGGISNHQTIAPLLEAHGWRGHFFVTTAWVGAPGFMGPAELRDLAARGHVIGSHTHTHPRKLSALGTAALADEWRRSADALRDILGADVTAGAVPGGFTSRDVADTAAAAGLVHLFDSESRTRVRRNGAQRLYGRYTVWRDTPLDGFLGLIGRSPISRLRQSVSWETKKIAKQLLGERWFALRQRLLGLRD
ncbi:MAG: polysaccharide deacetylase family protein [Gemmatirosa sp.]|nr:polysaccharide deacetylase family protein [Gemmatirosa sp.]